MKRPHVLLLAFGFPPARGSGVYRLRAWANHLARNGFDVTVLTADQKYWQDMTGELDLSLLETVDSRVEVLTFPFPHEHMVQDVASMSWLHANFPAAYIRSWKWLSQSPFPEVYGHLYPVLVARGLAAAATRRFDLVLATGNPYAQFGAAWRLGQLLRIPYVVDYHDPWSLDLWKEEPAFPADSPVWDWERRILDGARLTVTVNEPLVDWYRETYPEISERVRLVELGFDETVVHDPGFRPRTPGEPLRFGFVGTIRSDLPLEEFLEGWALARQHEVMAGATMTFFGYRGFFSQHQRSIEDMFAGRAADGVSLGGPVPQTQLTGVYAELDALAMLLTSSRFVTAGKGYDYMASGRPVLGVHDPRNHTTDVFANYPAFYPVAAVEPQAIADGILATAQGALTMTAEVHEQCRKVALTHTWDAAIEPVATEMLGWFQ